MRITGLPADAIMAGLVGRYPEIPDVLARVREAIPWTKREIWPFQAAALYALARGFDHPGGQVLEIGTAWGYSAAILSCAIPRGMITTLNPKVNEYKTCLGTLAPFENVVPVLGTSAEVLAQYPGPYLDLVFVDGSHLYADVKHDCGWWGHVKYGGLLLFHDYSPEGSRRPSVEAVQAIDEFGEELGRGPDVLVIDDELVGMAGWFKP